MNAQQEEQRPKIEVSSIAAKVVKECKPFNTRQKIDSETFPISGVTLEHGRNSCSSEMSFRSIKDSILSPRKATEKERIKDGKTRDIPNMTFFSESFPITSEIKSCKNENLSTTLTINESYPASSAGSPPSPIAPHSSPVWPQRWLGLYGGGTVLGNDTSEDSHELYESVCEKLLKRDYLEYVFSCRRWKESESEGLMVSEMYKETEKKTPSRKRDKNVGKELGGVELDRLDVVSFSTTALAARSKHLALHQKSRIVFTDHHRRISSYTDGIAKAFTTTMPGSTPIQDKKLNNGADFDVNLNNGSTRDVHTCNLFCSVNAGEFPMSGTYSLAEPSSKWEQTSLEREVPRPSSTLVERPNLDSKVSRLSLFENIFQEFPKISPSPLVLASKQCVRSKSTNSAEFGSSQREEKLKGAMSKNDTKTARSFLNARFSEERRDERPKLSESSICKVKGQRSYQDNLNHASVRLSLPQQVTNGSATVNTVQRSTDRKKVMEYHNKEHDRDTRDSSSKEFNVLRKPSFGIPWKTFAMKSAKELEIPPSQMNNLSPRSSSGSIFRMPEMKSGQLETVFRDGIREYNFWVENFEQFSTKIQCKDIYEIGSSSDQVATIFSLKGKQTNKSKWKNWRRRKPAPIPVAKMKLKASMHMSDEHENGEHCVRAEYVLYTPQEGAQERDSVVSANLDPHLNLLTSHYWSGIESSRCYPSPLTCPSSPKQVILASDSQVLPVSTDLTTKPDPNQPARRCHWSFAESKLHEFSSDDFTKGSNADYYLPLEPSEELASIVTEVAPKKEKYVHNFGDELVSGHKFTPSPTHRRAHSSFVPNFFHTAAKDIQYLMHKGLRSSPAAFKGNYGVLRRSGSSKESTIYRLNQTEGIHHNNVMIPVSERSPQLDKCFKNQIDFKAEHQNSCTDIEGDSVTIILPAGEHGHPKYGQSRPQPLIDRWRSGGKCDCGNWDLGCGLVILKNQLDKLTSLDGDWRYSGDNSNQNNLLEFYIQGRRTSMPALVLTPRHEGQFLLQFQATISPLQAFAIALAILHSNLELARLASRSERMENINAECKNKLLCNSEVCESALPGSRSEFLRNVSFSQGHHLDPPFYQIERV